MTSSPEETLRQLSALSAQIVSQRRLRNAGKFKSINQAISLQRLEKQREALMRELPPFHLV